MAEIVGEWFADTDDQVCATLDGGAVVNIALVNPDCELDVETTAAHTALIAAAPRMYDALKRLAKPAPGVKALPAWAVGIANAAIAKAKP